MATAKAVREVFLHTIISSSGERKVDTRKIPVAKLSEPAQAIEQALHNVDCGVTGVAVDENFPNHVREVHLDNIEVSHGAIVAAHHAALPYSLKLASVCRNRENEFDLDLKFTRDSIE